MKVLIISAHPDDETLGCGGTILKHTAAGDAVTWVIATQAHPPQWPEEVVQRKAREVERVAAAYGIAEVVKLGFPTVRLEAIPQIELMQPLHAVVDRVRPEIVYCVHGGDIHSDHGALFYAAASVFKPFRTAATGTRRLLCYEIVSSTEQAPPLAHRAFLPNAFSDITPHLERKLEIMAMFESELQPDPLPRGPGAIRALGRLRGATIGVEYAEAFMLLRDIF